MHENKLDFWIASQGSWIWKNVPQLKPYGFKLGRRGFKFPKYIFKNKNWDLMFSFKTKNHTTLVYTYFLTIGIYQLDYLWTLGLMKLKIGSYFV